ncbi:hypothetical protein Cthiooxydans_15380 [Comamonas thiooxydans]|uniref:hypothetical protein n=1 Tax=Comamonas thiooxydans TaxID=363952 RepID=UPI001E4B9FB2|nr:hypothetical protein [Comamonas thiooxydans]BDB69126.1 hypothetical protein Cthiooxydans_15380 [Comamonas thiooxydans]
MNNYYRIAARYFEQFEGAKYFPKWWDWRLILLALSLIAFGVAIYWYFFANSPALLDRWPVLVPELIGILASYSILAYRHQALVADLPDDEDAEREFKVHHAKRKALAKLTDSKPSEFIQLLEEIKKLQALEQELRSKMDPSFLKTFWNFINHPLLPKVGALLLIAIGIAFGKVENLTNLNPGQFINSPITLSMLWATLQLIAGLVIIGVMLYMLTGQLLELAALLISIKWPSKHGNATVLEYMKRDLIKYYIPEPKPTAVGKVDVEQPHVAEPERQAEPTSLGVAIAALGIKALYTAWLNRKPPLKN